MNLVRSFDGGNYGLAWGDKVERVYDGKDNFSYSKHPSISVIERVALHHNVVCFY